MCAGEMTMMLLYIQQASPTLNYLDNSNSVVITVSIHFLIGKSMDHSRTM